MASTLDQADIAKLAANAGFKGGDIATAVAVAMAESGGNPRAHNTNASTGDNSYGLWQINMLGAMGPDRRKAFGIKSNDELFDPATNARAAKKIHAQQGWKGWTTYTSGAYKKHLISDADLANAIGGLTKPVQEGVNNVDPETNDPLVLAARAISSVNSVGSNLFKAFANFQGILMAVTFIVIGIVILLRGQVSKVIPQGKVLKAVKGVAAK